MAVLFGKSRSTINEHILNVYTEGELVETETKRKIGNSDFSTKRTISLLVSYIFQYTPILF